MKYRFLLFLFYTIGFLQSQNLVLNPSFENYNKCPTKKSEFNSNVINWSSSNYGTTDYFNACNTYALCGNYNFKGYQKARTGNGYAGFYTYAPNNYKEYVQGQLKTPLIKGRDYNITFYVSLSDCSSHATKTFGVLLTEKQLNPLSSDFIHLKNLKKKHLKYSYIPVEKGSFYYNNKDWVEINLIYKAQGFEQFISIGNFDINKNLEIKEVKEDTHLVFSYYYIDDVSVIDRTKIKKKVVLDTTTKLNEHKNKVLKTEKIYSFKNLQFDFNKAELLEDSVKELSELYDYLIKHPNLNIEIYGHTDNIGSDEVNTALSLKRATTVSNYLITLGLLKNRIKTFGFGSSRPLEVNSINTSKNRRVEFKLILKK